MLICAYRQLKKTGRYSINPYAIIRRDGWPDPEALQTAARRSTEVGNDVPNDIRWIRSYVLGEPSGKLGTICMYQASSEDAVRQHAAAAGLPVTEVLPVADTVVVRADPEG